MDDKPQGTKPVTLEPTQWQWECSICGTVNTENDEEKLVTCTHKHCGTSFFTNFKKKKVDDKKEICIKWHIDDIIERAKERDILISEQQAIEILFIVERRHDASIGINWDVIDVHTDWYLDEVSK